MQITQVLSEEHQIILKALRVLLLECEKMESGKALDRLYFEKVVDFIKNYADTFHHAKEEDILFKAMLENLHGMHCNPIPVMLNEHEAGRNFVLGLEQGLRNNATLQILENARGYCYLLQSHIYKEDNVLYPMAEQALNNEQKERILALYTEQDTKFMLKSKLLQYENLLNEN
jgi:hemerythrin-like domain-containing protein